MSREVVRLDRLEGARKDDIVDDGVERLAVADHENLRRCDPEPLGERVRPRLVEHREQDVVVRLDGDVTEVDEPPPMARDQLEAVVVAGQYDATFWAALEPVETTGLHSFATSDVDERCAVARPADRVVPLVPEGIDRHAGRAEAARDREGDDLAAEEDDRRLSPAQDATGPPLSISMPLSSRSVDPVVREVAAGDAAM